MRCGYDEVDADHNLSDAPGIGKHDGGYNTGYNARGNLTSVWRSQDGSDNINNLSKYNYDIAGNVVAQRDPNGNFTRYSYNDDGANQYAFPTRITNALNQSTVLRYDYGAGKLSHSADGNNVSTDYAYNDPLDRLIETVQAGIQTNYQYPNPTTVIRYQDQNNGGDRALQSETDYDPMGRVAHQRTVESGSASILTDTTYDSLGRVAAVSNPYRPNDSVNWTGYTYDALGRTKQVQYADHSASQTSYTGTMTSVTDEAGKQKQYVYDGVGRLLSVQENPGGLSYGTGYQYDALDNLTLVTQGGCPGCQQRNFSYDGLGRLLSAANPESGTATYNYDSNGNLWHKTDGQGVTSTYAYDGLNRVTQKSYSNDSTPGYQTPTVWYTYDDGNVSNSVGRLTQIHSDVSTTEYLAYDPLGRVTSSRQDTSGQSYKFGYSYNLAGALTSETYPSGRSVSTGFDSVNRPVSVRGNFGGVNTGYASVNQYWPHGPAYKTAYGNQVVHTNWNYTPRLQPANGWDAIYDDGNYFIFDESMDWGGAGSNNGNLYGRTVYQGGPGTIPGIPSFGQSFSYDGVNRLTGVTDPGYTRQFGYDQWGNMAVTSGNGVPLNGTTPTDAVNGVRSRDQPAASGSI